MAFVDDDEVEKIRRELLVDVALFLGAAHGLVEREVDFVALVHQLGGFVHRQIHLFQRDISLRIDPLNALGIGTELGHGALEGAKVVDHGLINQDVAVGQKQDALFGFALPQTPDDLKRRVGFSGAGGHDQQHAVLARCDGLHRAVYRVELVIARGFVGRVVKACNTANFGRPAFPGAVTLPQLLWRGKLVKGNALLQHVRCQGGISEHKAVAVAAKAKWNTQQLRVLDGLLRSGAHRMVVVLGLHHCQGNIGFIEQGVIGPQHRAFIALGLLAANDHAAGAQGKLPVDLFHAVPSGPLHGGADELVANVAFREFGLVHAVVIGEMARPIGECYESRPLLCTTHSAQDDHCIWPLRTHLQKGCIPWLVACPAAPLLPETFQLARAAGRGGHHAIVGADSSQRAAVRIVVKPAIGIAVLDPGTLHLLQLRLPRWRQISHERFVGFVQPCILKPNLVGDAFDHAHGRVAGFTHAGAVLFALA